MTKLSFEESLPCRIKLKAMLPSHFRYVHTDLTNICTFFMQHFKLHLMEKFPLLPMDLIRVEKLQLCLFIPVGKCKAKF